jgi:hypothetical protein
VLASHALLLPGLRSGVPLTRRQLSRSAAVILSTPGTPRATFAPATGGFRLACLLLERHGMNEDQRPGLLFWSALIFSAAGLSATTAHAQERAPTPRPEVQAEILCFEALDAGATQGVVRALVGHDAEIVHDPQTNCLVIVGAADLTEARRVVGRLETRMHDRRAARGRRRGRARPPG